ncbi:hypothetical protein [Paucidesulfovibrio longus]|uniref:hypothetical protein n=1 Tax=Paucidesulfovibrio longus TaxID=889 RepID=UPI0003B7A310|nr:hypothetical protein [Paucidesulfovibrio longus]
MCAMTIDNNANYSIYNLGLGLGNSSSTSSTSSSRSSRYGGGVESMSTQELRAQIDKLLEDVPVGSSGKLSFADVMDYRDKLRNEFEAIAKEDLEALGVDTERDFSLSYNATTGKVTVDSSHPDKAIIDKYFEDTPEMTEAFAKIVTLSKLTATAENKLSPTEFKRQMQTQAMAWWAEGNGSSDWFSGGGMMLSPAGMSMLAGVNIQV